MGIFASQKQVILVRTDLNLSKGKMAVQVAHASVDAAFRTRRGRFRAWKWKGMKKIVLKVNDEDELRSYHELAKKKGLVSVLITDAGLTSIPPGTTTCLGIGPDDEAKIDEITGNLKMM